MAGELLSHITTLKEIAESLVYRSRNQYETKYIIYAANHLADEYAAFQLVLAQPEGRFCATNPTVHDLLVALFIQLYNTKIYFIQSGDSYAADILATLDSVLDGVREASLLRDNLPAPPSPVKLNPDEMFH